MKAVWAVLAVALVALVGAGAAWFVVTGEGRAYGPAQARERVLAALDLERPELAQVRAAAEAAGPEAALRGYRELLAGRDWPAVFVRGHDIGPAEHERVAREALEGIYTQQGVTAEQPRRADGGIDWGWRGPRDDREWAWFMNRHIHWVSLLRAWRQTGEARYARAIAREARDWVEANPPPGRMSFSHAWRALEAARRIDGPWFEVVAALFGEAALDEEAAVLILASMVDHARYLRAHHAPRGNHLVTELTALALVALAFPEFEESGEWLAYAGERLEAEILRQTYADGAQRELANHYQRVAIQSFRRYARLVEAAREQMGREAGVSAGYAGRLAKMKDYFRLVMRPDGTGPLNNDSDLEDNRELLEGWTGEPVEVPEEDFVAPFAGHAVLRGEGVAGRRMWAFFDGGWHGTDHQHEDRLHVSLTLGGRDVLVDSGRYSYAPGPWRDYFAGARGHNGVLLNGEAAARAPLEGDGPAPLRYHAGRGFAWAAARNAWPVTSLGGTGGARHLRVVLRLAGGRLLVVDRVLVARPTEVAVRWHFHPDWDLAEDAPGGAGGLALTAGQGAEKPGAAWLSLPAEAGEGGWTVALARGQQEPYPQGWYSPEYNERYPALAATYRRRAGGPLVTGWLFSAGGEAAPGLRREARGGRQVFTIGAGKGELEVSLDLRLIASALDGVKVNLGEAVSVVHQPLQGS